MLFRSKEWEWGTIEQLIATPVGATELIFGKFIPYFIIGFFDFLLVVGMSEWLLKVPLRGNVLILFFISAIFLAGALSLGIWISVANKKQFPSSQMALLLTFLPSFLLTGFACPIYNMPAVLQWISYIVPARYFIMILRSIYLKGTGLESFWKEALVLALFMFLFLRFAIKGFKKKVA